MDLGQEDEIKSIPQFQNIIRNYEFKEEKFGLAITGQVFRYIVENREKKGFEDILREILDNTKVYARMSPDDKALLIECL